MVSEAALRRKFVKTLEGKLEIAARNNSGTIAGWEISRSLGMLSVFCDEDRLNERVLGHVATSVVRMLGVGKRLGIVDRSLSTLTVECSPHVGGDVFFHKVYPID